MKILKYIVAYTFIGAGIMSNIMGAMEWVHIPFMRGLAYVLLSLIMLGVGVIILRGDDDER